MRLKSEENSAGFRMQVAPLSDCEVGAFNQKPSQPLLIYQLSRHAGCDIGGIFELIEIFWLKHYYTQIKEKQQVITTVWPLAQIDALNAFAPYPLYFYYM